MNTEIKKKGTAEFPNQDQKQVKIMKKKKKKKKLAQPSQVTA